MAGIPPILFTSNLIYLLVGRAALYSVYYLLVGRAALYPVYYLLVG